MQPEQLLLTQPKKSFVLRIPKTQSPVVLSLIGVRTTEADYPLWGNPPLRWYD